MVEKCGTRNKEGILALEDLSARLYYPYECIGIWFTKLRGAHPT